MADIVISIVTKFGQYLVEPVIREGQYFLCVQNIINDLKNEKEKLIIERDSMLNRVEQAKERSEIIEKPVEKWLNDVKNVLEEVADLERNMEANNNCFQGRCPTLKRYRLCKQMEKKTKAIVELEAQSNIQPFSYRAPLPGIQYESSENFVYFESTKVAYDQLMDALQDDWCYMIGVYGMGGSGKTSLVTQVGKKAEELNLFDKVMSITVSQTPNIRYIQGKLADMLNLELKEESNEGRAQRIWMNLKEKERVLIIVDDLWGWFELRDIGICLENNYKGRWKVLLTTRRQEICNSMGCQKRIHLGLLSEDESWALFQRHANIDDEISSKTMNDVPQKLCKECKGLPVAIIAMGSSLKGKSNAEWEVALSSLTHSEVIDDHMEEGARAVLSCLKLSYDYLKNKEAELLFLICSMFPEDYDISTEDLIRYAIGLGMGGRLSLESARCRIQAGISKLLDSCLLLHSHGYKRKEYVKMHDMVRDVALWMALRSEDQKILVNLDKPLGTMVMDFSIRDYFAISSWYNENQISFQLDAPNLEILLLDIMPQGSLDLSHVTFQGIDELKVFAVINQQHSYHAKPPLSLPHSIELLTNLRTVRLNWWHLDDISFITSLTRLEVLDLRNCRLNELPMEMGKLKKLKMLDLSGCGFLKNYNGVIAKCLQLQELYASECDSEFLSQGIMDIVTHSKLQSFVIYFVKTIMPFVLPLTLVRNTHKRVIELEKFDISNLRASGSNLLQIADVVRLSCFHGGCKNVIPELIRVVGGMNNLSSLRLYQEEEIECIFNATSDSNNLDSLQVDALIPRLVELHLSTLKNLKQLCRGPPQLFLEKLENLYIWDCLQLHTIFPVECNLQNLKILTIENWKYGTNCMLSEALFSMSVAQSLQQLKQLTIRGFDALKHIIASGRGYDSNTSKEILAPRNYRFVMSNLQTFMIADCSKIESLFPICCVEGLVQLQKVTIRNIPLLKYVFGECDHMDHSYLQYENQIMLPHFKVLEVEELGNLIGMCPKNYPAKWPSSWEITIEDCPKFTMMAGSE